MTLTIFSIHNMIKFNARGTFFSIPKYLLEKKPETLLCVLASTELNASIPIDSIQESIYIDVDPKYIDDIVDYYDLHSNVDDREHINDLYGRDIYMYMDMVYLGFVDIGDRDNIKKFKHYPLVTTKIDCTEKHNSIPEKSYELCDIHTSDNKIIPVNLLYYVDTNNVLVQILHGQHEEHILYKKDKTVGVWLGIPETYLHPILSIIRDGIVYYYGYISDNISLTSVIFEDIYDSDVELEVENWGHRINRNVYYETYYTNNGDTHIQDVLSDLCCSAGYMIDEIKNHLKTRTRNNEKNNREMCRYIARKIEQYDKSLLIKKNTRILDYLKKYDVCTSEIMEILDMRVNWCNVFGECFISRGDIDQSDIIFFTGKEINSHSETLVCLDDERKTDIIDILMSDQRDNNVYEYPTRCDYIIQYCRKHFDVHPYAWNRMRKDNPSNRPIRFSLKNDKSPCHMFNDFVNKEIKHIFGIPFQKNDGSNKSSHNP